MTEKAFGLLIRLAVKTGIRASDFTKFRIHSI
jgi:hypothetical protein